MGSMAIEVRRRLTGSSVSPVNTMTWPKCSSIHTVTPRPPAVSSGLRIGTPALATRGLGVEDFVEVGKIIATALQPGEFEARRVELAERVQAIVERYPLYVGLGASVAV